MTAVDAPPVGVWVPPWLLWGLLAEIARLTVALEDCTFERDMARRTVEDQQEEWSAERAANPPRSPRTVATRPV